MRLVKQRHKHGCAVASIAMITGIGYNKVLKSFFPKRNHRELDPIMFGDIFNYLNKENIKYKIIHNIPAACKIKRLNTLKHNAIILLFPGAGKGGHSVVWDHENQKVIDPWAWKADIINDKNTCENINSLIIEMM